MTTARIRAAFEQKAMAWAAAQSPPLPGAWTNVKFDPTEGPYCKPILIPARTQSRDLGGLNRSYIGIFQISLYLPAGTGPGIADALAASLDAEFPVEEPLGDEDFQIFITAPMSPAAGLEEADRYVVPVSCMYMAGEYLP